MLCNSPQSVDGVCSDVEGIMMCEPELRGCVMENLDLIDYINKHRQEIAFIYS